jgi:hypothetical protein
MARVVYLNNQSPRLSQTLSVHSRAFSFSLLRKATHDFNVIHSHLVPRPKLTTSSSFNVPTQKHNFFSSQSDQSNSIIMSDKLIPSDPDHVMVIRNVTPNIATFSVPFSRFGKVKIGGRGTLGMLFSVYHSKDAHCTDSIQQSSSLLEASPSSRQWH